MAGNNPTQPEARRVRTFTVEEVSKAKAQIDEFNQVFTMASSYQFDRRYKALGIASIEDNKDTKEELTEKAQQVGRVQHKILKGDIFCCDKCQEGTLGMFNNDGFCAWCVLEIDDKEEEEKIPHRPNCCDYHSAEGMNEAPCATWQGGSNYSPNFEGAESNELFRSHVLHQIDTNGLDLARLTLGWDNMDCPADCGEVVYIREHGDGILCSCDACEVEAFL